MKIAVPKETRAGERRVALVPESCKKLIGKGITVAVESGAGEAAYFADDAYRAVGATIESDVGTLLGGADLILTVQPPTPAEVARCREGAHAAGHAPADQAPGYGAGAGRPEDHRVFDRLHPANHAGPVDGHAVGDVEHRRLQGRGDRRQRTGQVLSDVHDRRRDHLLGQGVRDRGRRGRVAGDRDRQASGGHGHRDRHAAGGGRAGAERGRQVRRRGNGGGRPDRQRVRQGTLRRLLSQAGAN